MRLLVPVVSAVKRSQSISGVVGAVELGIVVLRFVWPGLSKFLARRCAERCSAKGKWSNGRWELGYQGGVWYGARSDVIARKLVDAARAKKIVERSGIDYDTDSSRCNRQAG